MRGHVLVEGIISGQAAITVGITFSVGLRKSQGRNDNTEAVEVLNWRFRRIKRLSLSFFLSRSLSPSPFRYLITSGGNNLVGSHRQVSAANLSCILRCNKIPAGSWCVPREAKKVRIYALYYFVAAQASGKLVTCTFDLVHGAIARQHARSSWKI